MKLRSLFLSGIILFSLGARAQSHEQRCATSEKIPAHFSNFEQYLQKEIDKRKAEEESGRVEQDIYVIPIIVHVIHQGEPIGTGTNISQAQIQSQIDVLNEDFRRSNLDRATTVEAFRPVAADTRIEFVLATTDSAGRPLPEPGVHRYQHQKGEWTFDEFNEQVKPITIWDPKRYFNIWTVRNLIGFYGYTQFPDLSGLAGLDERDGTEFTDGVILDYDKIGSYDKLQIPILEKGPYNLGRTLTHEMGHAFGLLHTWGANRTGDCNFDMDYCPDTPTLQTSTSGCDLQRQSCGHLVMIQNYMDYSYDACMTLFTRDQARRMRTVLEVSPRRKELVSRLTAVPAEQLGRRIVAYPNPAQDNIRLDAPGMRILNYKLCNMLGQAVLSEKFEQPYIDLASIGAGVYVLQLETDRGLAVKRIVVQK